MPRGSSWTRWARSSGSSSSSSWPLALCILLASPRATAGFEDPRAPITVHHEPIEIWPLIPTKELTRDSQSDGKWSRTVEQVNDAPDAAAQLQQQQRSTAALARRRPGPRVVLEDLPDNDTSRERLLLLPVFGIFALCAIVLLLAMCGTDADRSNGTRPESEELMTSSNLEQHAVAVESACLQRRACNPMHL